MLEMESDGRPFSHDDVLAHVLNYLRNIHGKSNEELMSVQLFPPGMTKNVKGNVRRRAKLYRYDEESDELYFVGKQV